jgi:hypothetical protein
MFWRHCERSEAIQLAAQRKNGLLRCARNDELNSGLFEIKSWLFETTWILTECSLFTSPLVGEVGSHR